MSQQNQPPAVKIRHYDIASLVRQAEGDDLPEPDVVYEFSGGREFESTDATESGIYRK
jgi:hypothetical protein